MKRHKVFYRPSLAARTEVLYLSVVGIAHLRKPLGEWDTWENLGHSVSWTWENGATITVSLISTAKYGY